MEVKWTFFQKILFKFTLKILELMWGSTNFKLLLPGNFFLVKFLKLVFYSTKRLSIRSISQWWAKTRKKVHFGRTPRSLPQRLNAFSFFEIVLSGGSPKETRSEETFLKNDFILWGNCTTTQNPKHTFEIGIFSTF